MNEGIGNGNKKERFWEPRANNKFRPNGNGMQYFILYENCQLFLNNCQLAKANYLVACKWFGQPYFWLFLLDEHDANAASAIIATTAANDLNVENTCINILF
jgi:hypothetical protein